MICLLCLGCTKEQTVKISVKNPTEQDRKQETLELVWNKLQAQLPVLDAANAVVTDAAGEEIPSQVVFNGGELPVGLIFQADVKAQDEAVYFVKAGTPAKYKTQIFGRLVPERKDDFAWENNRIAYRMYGPALEATGEISNGIDVWVKRTDELVVDDWYKKDDYHRDHGQGLDCYKVGRTLGAGAMAPYIDTLLVLGNNFISSEILDEGPLRIRFLLKYAPYGVDSVEWQETRTITLDANTPFNKIEELYRGNFEVMPVAAGIVMREGGEQLQEAAEGVIGYWEPENGNDGHTAIGVIFPNGASAVTVGSGGHLLALSEAGNGVPFVYYAGAGWSKNGFENAGEWFALLKDEAVRLGSPLVVSY